MFLKIEHSCNTSLALKCQGKKWIKLVNNKLKIPERVLCELTNSCCALVVSLGLTLGKQQFLESGTLLVIQLLFFGVNIGYLIVVAKHIFDFDIFTIFQVCYCFNSLLSEQIIFVGTIISGIIVGIQFKIVILSSHSAVQPNLRNQGSHAADTLNRLPK